MRVILYMAPVSATAERKLQHELTRCKHKRNHMGETLVNALAKTEAATKVRSIRPGKANCISSSTTSNRAPPTYSETIISVWSGSQTKFLICKF